MVGHPFPNKTVLSLRANTCHTSETLLFSNSPGIAEKGSRSMTLAQIVGDSKMSLRQYLETWEVCRVMCKALYGNSSWFSQKRLSSVMSALIEKMKRRISFVSLVIGGEVLAMEGFMMGIIAVWAYKTRI